MELLTKIEDVQKYVKIDGTLTFASISSYLEPAEETILRIYASDELVDAVKANLDLPETDRDAKLSALEPYMRRILANFIIKLASADIDIKVQNNGFMVNNNDNASPASSQRVERFNDNRLELGLTAVESLLRFLERNRADYPQWTASEACTIFSNVIIRTAEEFDRIIDINKSRLTFQKYKPTMLSVEDMEIASHITVEYLTALRIRIKDNNTTAADNIILPNLQRAIAYFTHSKMCESNTAGLQFTAEKYLGAVMKVMWATPSDYTEFMTSPSYFERTDYTKNENSQSSGFFIAGGGASFNT